MLLVLGRVWGSGCTVVILWLTAREALDGPAFGRFTFYLALFAVLDSLSDLGTAQLAVQRTADDPGAVVATLRAARRIRIRAALFGAVLVGGGALLAGERDAFLVLLAALYPITNALELSAVVFRNRISWGLPVSVRAGSNGAALVAVLLLVARDVDSPAAYLIAIAITSAAANLVLHLLSRKHIPPASETAQTSTREFFWAALPLGIGGLCQQAYFYIDNLYVRALVSEEALGHYNVAVRVLSVAIMIAIYATLTALPWFTRAHAKGELGVAIRRLGAPLFALAGLAIGLLLPFSGALLAIFGEEFRAATESLHVLLLGALLVYLGAVRITALVATGSSRAVLVVTLSALVVNLVGNAVLVPLLAIEGAAIATLATEASVALGAGIALRRIGVDPLGGSHAIWLGGPIAVGIGIVISQATGLPW